jgi:hypothetical protein
MARFLGLRGSRLKTAMLLLVVAPSFILFGYNNGSTGGISTLESFLLVSQAALNVMSGDEMINKVQQFPLMKNARIKGLYFVYYRIIR